MIERLSMLGRRLVRYVVLRRDHRVDPGVGAPDFTLPNQDGELTQLSSLRGSAGILYFYPEADTSGDVHRPSCPLSMSCASVKT
jgi:peroxiredoxin